MFRKDYLIFQWPWRECRDKGQVIFSGNWDIWDIWYGTYGQKSPRAMVLLLVHHSMGSLRFDIKRETVRQIQKVFRKIKLILIWISILTTMLVIETSYYTYSFVNPWHFLFAFWFGFVLIWTHTTFKVITHLERNSHWIPLNFKQTWQRKCVSWSTDRMTESPSIYSVGKSWPLQLGASAQKRIPPFIATA